jgi:hypothetical protein
MPVTEVNDPASVPSAEIAERDALIVELETLVKGHHHSPALNAMATVMARIFAEIPNGSEMVVSFTDDIRKCAILERNARLNS